MMVFGVDPHKQSHTAVAAAELGREKAQKTARARRDGHRELIAWARELAPAGRAWAVEDVRHVAGGLIRELLAAGEQVVFVPPKLMAGERRGGRERGKSDPIDALAIARLALREGAGLPAARLDEQVLEVRRLTDYRDDLVAERTRVVNRLRWMVHDLAPGAGPGAAVAGLWPGSHPAGGRAACPARRRRAAGRAVPAGPHDGPVRRDHAAGDRPGRPGHRPGPRTAGHPRGRRDHRRQDPGRGRRHPPVPQPGRLRPAQWHRPRPRLQRYRPRRPPPPQPGREPAAQRCPPPYRRGPGPLSPRAASLLQRRGQDKHETRKASLRVLKRHLSDVIYRALNADAWRLGQPAPHAA